MKKQMTNMSGKPLDKVEQKEHKSYKKNIIDSVKWSKKRISGYHYGKRSGSDTYSLIDAYGKVKSTPSKTLSQLKEHLKKGK